MGLLKESVGVGEGILPSLSRVTPFIVLVWLGWDIEATPLLFV